MPHDVLAKQAEHLAPPTSQLAYCADALGVPSCVSPCALIFRVQLISARIVCCAIHIKAGATNGSAPVSGAGAGAAQEANGQVFALKFTLKGHSRAVSAIKYRCVVRFGFWVAR